jgi:hypothetical protein
MVERTRFGIETMPRTQRDVVANKKQMWSCFVSGVDCGNGAGNKLLDTLVRKLATVCTLQGLITKYQQTTLPEFDSILLTLVPTATCRVRATFIHKLQGLLAATVATPSSIHVSDIR